MFASRHEPAYMLLPSERTDRRKPKTRRFLIVILVAGFLFLASTTALVLRKMPSVVSAKMTVNRHGADDPRLEKYQAPSDAISCKEWAHISSNTSLASFILPATSSLTFFLTRGAPTQGHFDLHKSSSYSRDSSYIFVNITATYDDPNQLEKSRACQAGLPLELENGIMLWASKPPHGVTFHFAVQLPGYPRKFGDISADFSSSAYSISVGGFGDIWRPVYFGVQRYLTNNGNISFSDIIAPSVYLETSNAPITGGFSNTDEAYIRTSNALVSIMIWTFAIAPSSASNITIQTTNASVIAILALVPDNPGSTFNTSIFNTSISTTNGELTCMMISGTALDSRPLDNVTYIVDASTSNAPAHILVPDDYEGSFAIQTTGSHAHAHAEWDSEVKDPFSKGRNRSLVLDEWEQERMVGSIYWGDTVPQGRDLGNVRVKTSGGDVTLLTRWDEPSSSPVD